MSEENKILPLKANVTPVSVLVNWSESRELNEGDVYPFKEFEKKALEVARQNASGGYDKTNVTVTFDNDSEHQCRLDLGCGGNDTGFADHCLSVYHFHQLHHESKTHPWMASEQQDILIQLIESYVLDKDWVKQSRLKAEEAVRLVKEQEAMELARKQAMIREAAKARIEQEKAFQNALVVPDWAQSVIIATRTEYDTENSIPEIGDYESKTMNTIILAWSKHKRNLFSEMRKACLNHPDTAFLNDIKQSVEHRDNYSMGAGYYLTDVDYLRHGWKVYKRNFWDKGEKSRYVPLGEMAI